MTRKINQAGLDLVKRFEGFRPEAYRDAAGVWTIGYGSTERAGVGIVPRPGMIISKQEAEYYLEKALNRFSEQIAPSILAPANDNEFSAFLSLAYNIGPAAFKRSSALKHFNAGDKAKAANAILLWNKADRKVLPGLVKRREAERQLFLTPAPDPLLHAPEPAPARSGGLWGVILAFLRAVFGGR